MERLRRAKTGRLGEPGTLVNAAFESEKPGSVPIPAGSGRRWTRMPDGNVPAVGVDGKTLTHECGERPSREPDVEDIPEGDGDAREALLVLDALEWEWLCAVW